MATKQRTNSTAADFLSEEALAMVKMRQNIVGAVPVSPCANTVGMTTTAFEKILQLAEELGRSAAKSEILNRRAYGMLELLIGAAIMALAQVFIWRWLGWLPR